MYFRKTLIPLCFGIRICYLIRTAEKNGGFFAVLYITAKIPLELHFSIFVVSDKLALVGANSIQKQTYANAEAVDKGILLADYR